MELIDFIDFIDYSELMPGATACVQNFMEVTEGDNILIITDKPIIAGALAKASIEAGGDVIVIYLPNLIRPIEKLSDTLKSLIIKSDVIFTPFDAIEKESRFRREIIELADEGNGRKIAHMPSVTSGMFRSTGMISLNSEEMQKMVDLTEKLAILLSATKRIEISSPVYSETNLSMELEGWNRSGIVSTGHIMKGSWGNLPSGEAFVVPKIGTTHGTIVIDMAIAGVPSSELPVTVEVTNGIININSIKDGETLKNILKKYGDDVRTVGEFGIGTNPKPSYNFSVIEIEKIMRTIHIGIGNNALFGGDIKAQVPHIDMVTSRVNVMVKDLQSINTIDIIKEGTIQVDHVNNFFKIDYHSFSKDIHLEATVNVIGEIKVKDEKGMLYRCWSDFRGHKLRIAVGNDATSKEVLKVWNCIDSTRTNKVKDILKKFDKKFGENSELAYKLLNTLEIFGIIKITKPNEHYKA